MGIAYSLDHDPDSKKSSVIGNVNTNYGRYRTARYIFSDKLPVPFLRKLAWIFEGNLSMVRSQSDLDSSILRYLYEVYALKSHLLSSDCKLLMSFNFDLDEFN